MKRTPPRDRYGRPLPHGSRNELRHEAEPDQVAGTTQACRRAIALFNEQRFFESHEFFEQAWNAADVDYQDRNFWKALTQLAVGCCHAQRGNDPGALALLQRAADHLQHFPTPHYAIDTTALVAIARNVADQIRQRGASPNLDFPRFPTLSP